MKKKIFICGISTECCSYSTLIQNKKDFEVLSGKKLLKYINFPYSKHNNITFIPNDSAGQFNNIIRDQNIIDQNFYFVLIETDNNSYDIILRSTQ